MAQPDGGKLFRQNCAQCHSTGTNKVIGPGLKGVESRWEDKAKLHAWIKNSQEFLKTGDPYAVQLYEEYGKSVMPSFTLKDEEIDAILEFVKVESTKAPVTGPAGQPGVAVEDTKSNTILYILASLAVFLFILINVLSGVKRNLKNILNERNGLPPEIERPWIEGTKYWMLNNKKLVAIGGLIIVGWLSKVGWDSAMGIGIYTDYEPVQPIAFSHKIHAGENGISCNYCHSGAEKGKSANIPSLNVCMNCHNYIQQGPSGTKEIDKIYAALDYDKGTQKYGSNPKPMKWIRVHNLPDHAYFNHSQHVKVAGLDCENCHGPVKEMAVLRQHAPLTMGWCIDCHRKTEVKMEANPYYEELHKKLKEKYKGEAITVAKMGGLECSKCHY